VLVARAAGAVAFPARFTLVAAANPCPCGRAGEPHDQCVCTPVDVARYRGRLSGPLSDRIDMHGHVGAVSPRAMHGGAGVERSAHVRARVAAAWERQRRRYAAIDGVASNAQVSGRWLDAHGGVAADAREMLLAAAERFSLSARAYFRVMKVARTIADLEGDASVAVSHLAEALRYRPPLADAAGSGQRNAVRLAR
jgi:magnesium chelatase family protein